MSDEKKPYLQQAAEEGRKLRDQGVRHVPEAVPNDSTGQAYAPWDTPQSKPPWPTGMSHPKDQMVERETRRTSLQQQHEAIPAPRKPGMQQDVTRTDAADRQNDARRLEEARTREGPTPEPER